MLKSMTKVLFLESLFSAFKFIFTSWQLDLLRLRPGSENRQSRRVRRILYRNGFRTSVATLQTLLL